MCSVVAEDNPVAEVDNRVAVHSEAGDLVADNPVALLLDYLLMDQLKHNNQLQSMSLSLVEAEL